MKITKSLKNCTNTLRSLTNPIKKYVYVMKERNPIPQDALERDDQLISSPSAPHRWHKLRKTLRHIFRSRPQRATPERTGPFVSEDRPPLRTHYPNFAFEGTRSGAQMLQPPNSTINIQHHIPIDNAVHGYLNPRTAVPQEDTSFVDSGYGIDTAPHASDLTSTTNAYVEEYELFPNYDTDSFNLTRSSLFEEESSLSSTDEAIMSDSSSVWWNNTDGSHTLNSTEDFGAPTSDEATEQTSLANIPAGSNTDDASNTNVLGLTLFEEQDTLNAGEDSSTTGPDPVSPQPSPMLTDFPYLDDPPPASDSVLFASAALADEGTIQADNPQPFGTSSPSASVVRQGKSIHDLPVDILSVIFFHTLQKQILPDEWELDTPWPRPNHRESLSTLRRVCRLWNREALAPAIWNSNPVAWSVAKSTQPDSRARLACIRSHSTYANTVPINCVSYEIGGEPMTFTSDHIMDAICESVINCQAIRIVLPEWETDPTQTPVQDMPRLRVLSWTSPYTIHTILPPRWRLPWPTLSHAPWNQLTACFLDCTLTVEDCLSILQQSPRLKTLQLSHVTSSTTLINDDPDNSPVNGTLSSLKVSTALDINMLISNIRLPNLTDLHLDLTTYNEVQPLRRLQHMKFPWDSLKNLVLKCAMELLDAYQLFQDCHSVTKLEWHWPDSGDIIIPMLPLGHHLIGLPILRSLTITPTLPPYVVKSLLEAMETQITSSMDVTLPSLPRHVWNSTQAFTALITLTLTSPISATQCLLIMGWSTELEELDVLVNDINLHSTDMWPDHETPRYLERMVLRTPIKNLELLFHTITLPSLTAFELIFKADSHSTHYWAGDHRQGTHQKGLHSLLHRSRGNQGGTPLKRLVLDGIDIEATDLEAIINTTTSVETDLHITDTTIAKSSSTHWQNITSIIVASVTAGQNYSSRTALDI